jgi:hypothetical protein
MLKRYVLLGVILGALLTGWGCSDRGTNLPDYENIAPWGINPLANHVFDTLLALQIRNESQLLLGASYIPKEAIPAYGSKPVPTLVLLTPEDQDKFYYFNHGLLSLLQEMTQSGEIQPMAVYCVGNDQVFGGYWYGNSAPAGYYDGIIAAPGDSGLPGYLRSIIPATINSASKRGIGGVGTGSYGVFRALLKHPGVYSSVSVTDGPLDFDGSDNASGLIPLFKTAMDEQYLYRKSSRSTIKFDSLSTSPVSRILLGGAFAFSPWDTAVSFSYTPARQGQRDSIVRIILNSTVSVGDTTTLVKNLIVGMKDYHSYDPCMPFYIDSGTVSEPHIPGNVYNPMWNLWLRNNLDSLYGRAGGSPLAGVNMYFATSLEAPYNYYSMTQSWITFLKDNGLGAQITEHPYAGVNGVPAGDGAYLYDLLRKMLKFHSDNFGN